MGVLAIVNQKGGVGKTTTAVMLAHRFAMSRKRVLLVDLDSQGNVADCMGLPEGDDLYEMLQPGHDKEPLHNFVYNSGRKRLDVIRADSSTAGLKRALAGEPFAAFCLNDVLKNAPYDMVILDCAPSVDLLQTAAIVAADYIMIPTRLDNLAIKGVREVMRSIDGVQKKTKWKKMIAGILPTFYEQVTTESKRQLIHLAKTFGDTVLPPIPVDVRCREAARHGKTLWEFDPETRAIVGVTVKSGKVAGGYSEVFNRLRLRIKKAGQEA